MLKRILYVSLFLVFFALPAFGATYYVREDGHDSSCDGGTNVSLAGESGDGDDCAFLTINHALGVVSGTDIIEVEDGTYLEPQLVIPAGITLTAVNKDDPTWSDSPTYGDVIVRPMANMTADWFVLMDAGATVISGGQTVSYIHFDGEGGTYTAKKGFKVLNYNDVTITKNKITGFRGCTPVNKNDLECSGALHAQSDNTTDGHTIENSNARYSDMVEAPDMSKTAAYIGYTQMTGFAFTYNVVERCGDGNENERKWSNSIATWLLEDFDISYNKLDCSHEKMRCWNNTAALLENGVIHHNWIKGNDWGHIGAVADAGSNYTMELWVLHDVKIYNNKLINGNFSITYGKKLEVYNNFVDNTSASKPVGYSYECTFITNLQFHHNYSKYDGSTYNYGASNIGKYDAGSKDSTTFNLYVWGNIFEGFLNHGLIVDSSDPTQGDIVNAYIINNTFVNGNSATASALSLYEQSNSTMPAPVVQSNIFYNLNGYGVRDYNSSITDIVNGYNLWNDITGANTLPAGIYTGAGSYTGESNPVTELPTFAAGSWAVLNGNSPQVDAGSTTDYTSVGAHNVDMSKKLSSNTVWGTGTDVPSVVLKDPVDTTDIGAYEQGVDRFVKPSGGLTTGSCDTDNRCVMDYAIESVAQSGDTVYFEDGNYFTTNTTGNSLFGLDVPVGVSLTCEDCEADPTTDGWLDPAKLEVRMYPGGEEGYPNNNLIRLMSASLNTASVQTISYIDFQANGTQTVNQGMKIVNRNGVILKYINLENFDGNCAAGQGVEALSKGLLVYTTDPTLPDDTDYKDVFDANMVPNALWPANPVTNFDFSYSRIEHCGCSIDDVDNAMASGLYLKNLKDSEIDHNFFDHSHSNSQFLETAPAYWWNVDFHHNYVIVHPESESPIAGSQWCVELWVLVDCKFYNNKLVNSGYSITYGKNMEVYFNYVDMGEIDGSDGRRPKGHNLEGTLHDNAQFHHNLLVGRTDLQYGGYPWGINFGADTHAVKVGSAISNYVWGNLIINIEDSGSGSGIGGHAIYVGDGATTVVSSNNYIYNNTVLGSATGVIFRVGETVTSTSDFKNNLFQNDSLGALSDHSVGCGRCTGTGIWAFDHDLWFGLTDNSDPNSIYDDATNKVLSEATFAVGSYAPLNGSSPQVDAGSTADLTSVGADDVDMSKKLSSTTVWGTGSQLPVVVLTSPVGVTDIGAYEYGDLTDSTQDGLSLSRLIRK